MTMVNAVIAGYPIILPEHRHAFHSERPDWHKAWLDSIHDSLKPDDWVIDVGVEQGDLSALIASWIPDGRLVLVEPQPLFWKGIKATFEANELAPPKDSMVAFASDEWDSKGRHQLIWRGWPKIEPGADDPGFYHLNEHQTIPRNKLDVFGFTNAILIDVEGAELHVLKGAQELLKEHPLVWCAIHPEIMRDRYGHDPNDLLAYMRGLGYQVELLGFQGEVHARFYP